MVGWMDSFGKKRGWEVLLVVVLACTLSIRIYLGGGFWFPLEVMALGRLDDMWFIKKGVMTISKGVNLIKKVWLLLVKSFLLLPVFFPIINADCLNRGQFGEEDILRKVKFLLDFCEILFS